MFFYFTRQQALEKLNKFIIDDLKYYEKKRNFDYGVFKRDNVSCLSPYITNGLLSEYEILEKVLKKYNYNQAKKFIDEIFWRVYWRGWLENRPQLWEDYKKNLCKIKINDHYKNAISGKTKINCFNSWVEELKQYNYLHNHARMWFASIWIFSLGLPWQLGAEFFLEHLLDGDEASNTLSWRWVAGLQTKGKKYIARKSNIEYYSNHKVKENLLKNSSAIIEGSTYQFENISFFQRNDIKNDNLLILEDKLDFLYQENNKEKYKRIFILSLNDHERLNKLSKNVNLYKNNIIKKTKEDFLNVEIISLNEIIELVKKNKKFDVPYPLLGYNLDLLKKLKYKYNLEINFLFRELDTFCWQFSKKGFFNFKQNIPEIISKLNF